MFEELVYRNRISRDRWRNYSAHRERVTQLIEHGVNARGRLLLLGAGNCNDLDLQKLLISFSEIHLVDADAGALQWGVEQQGLAGNPSLFLHGDIDVTGIAAICSSWSDDRPPNGAELEQAARLASTHEIGAANLPFDAAASVGLLSQLLEMLIRSVGEGHPRLLDLVAAVRLRHMQLLMQSVRPGGHVLLVTEIVSSDSCPELPSTAEKDLLQLLQRMINARNFFTGLNPAVLESLWQGSPDLAPLVEQVEVYYPWLWDFGPRTYACTALSGVRSGA